MDESSLQHSQTMPHFSFGSFLTRFHRLFIKRVRIKCLNEAIGFMTVMSRRSLPPPTSFNVISSIAYLSQRRERTKRQPPEYLSSVICILYIRPKIRSSKINTTNTEENQLTEIDDFVNVSHAITCSFNTRQMACIST